MQTNKGTRLLTARRYDTIVIGAGQAGLSVGYYLAQHGRSFVILDANERVGDSWRKRWDSLRLFTSSRFDGLPGMPYPASSRVYPTKDEMADYLETYAKQFRLPVITNTRVVRLSKEGKVYLIDAGLRRFEANNVVIAMASFQEPVTPPFAAELGSDVRQIQSRDYRSPAQLQPGGVLVVGAGNSGAEIALDITRAKAGHEVWLSGRHPGNLPFKFDSSLAHYILKPILLRLIFHHVLTIETPIGRRVRRKVLSQGGPLIRVKPADLVAAGIHRVPRTQGVSHGRPVLSDGRSLDVANVIWSTGYRPGFSWIDLPIFGKDGELDERGGFTRDPGVSFVGLMFQYSMSSTMINGAGRDAKRIVDAIVARPASVVVGESRIAEVA